MDPNLSEIINAGTAQIYAVLPEYPRDLVVSRLQKYFGDVELALDELLAMDVNSVNELRKSGEFHEARKKKPKTPPKRQPRASGWSQQMGAAEASTRARYVHAKKPRSLQSEAPLPPQVQQHTKLPLEEQVVDYRYDNAGIITAKDDIYHTYRQEAIKVRRQRDKLREQAQACYLNGNDAEQRNKLAQVRSLAQRLEELNSNAAARIFEHHNSAEFGFGKFKMDLHGLHAQEAVEFLDARLRELCAELESVWDTSQWQKLDVVVGKGIHQDGSTILQPAVREFLEKARFKFEWLSRYGTFSITLHRGYPPQTQ